MTNSMSVLYVCLSRPNISPKLSQSSTPPHPILSHPRRQTKRYNSRSWRCFGSQLVSRAALENFLRLHIIAYLSIFLRISEKLETLFSLSLSKFGIVLVELITLATLSKLLSFSSTRLSVRLIYNFSQIVERI